MSTISSTYLYNSLVQPITQMQTSLATLSTESSTGQYANLGQQLGAESGQELSLKNQYDQLQSFTASNAIVGVDLSTSSDSLSSIQSDAQTAVQDITTWLSGQANSGVTLQTLGTSSLQSLTSDANAVTPLGQYVFGGVNSGVQPLSDYFSTPTSAAKTAIDQAFTTTFGMSPTDAAASTISPSDLQTFLNTTFADQFQGANWTSSWSSASSVNTTADVAPGESTQTSVNVNQPGFSQLAEGYAMLAEFGGSSLSQSAQQVVASTASNLISQGLTQITNLESTIGDAQNKVTDANNSISSQSTLLQTQIGDMDNVNEYQVASQLTTLSTQLQTAYSLTARLQQLSLAQYLPVV
jgi:flagellar hook-associated protein 3 FlgL